MASGVPKFQAAERDIDPPRQGAHPPLGIVIEVADIDHPVEGAIQARLAGGRLGQYHKNGLMDFLDAITARYGMHIIYTDSRDEAEERIANLASLHYAYRYAEEEGLGRYLLEGDL